MFCDKYYITNQEEQAGVPAVSSRRKPVFNWW